MPVSEAGSLSSGADCFERACRLLESRELHEALLLFSAAEQAGFSPDECGGGRWFCHMLAGEFERAWQESDVIAGRGAPDPNRLWSGRPLDGKNVIVRCLHGLGDAIQFMRFTPRLKPTVARLFVEVPGCLVRLFQTIPGVDEVFTWDDPQSAQPDWDEHIEVMELPRYFRVTLDTLSSVVPYLFPPEVPSIADGDDPSLVKVGIAWSSSSWNPSRSFPLHDFLPVLSIPGFRFFSLQKGEMKDAARDVPPELRPKSIISQTDDVQATASYVKQLDLVISVDTMVAHLAGALGTPVWLLLEKRADWRWMVERADSPWYPAMRIFRQAEKGCWDDVARNVAVALARRMSLGRYEITSLDTEASRA